MLSTVMFSVIILRVVTLSVNKLGVIRTIVMLFVLTPSVVAPLRQSKVLCQV
jgi:hypothetical protein